MNTPPPVTQPTDPRRRLRELLSIPERDRTEEQWDEIVELEIQTAPGNRAGMTGLPSGGKSGGGIPPSGNNSQQPRKQQQQQQHQRPKGNNQRRPGKPKPPREPSA
ncbi:MAG TPA: hypothetical protein VFF03_11690 [Rhodocyclaceae bacterium]|nr:hypothetical protein [Rhodocyclaceae bacterium]